MLNLLHETKWAASSPGCFILPNEPPVPTEKEVGWTLENRQILYPCQEPKLFSSVV